MTDRRIPSIFTTLFLLPVIASAGCTGAGTAAPPPVDHVDSADELELSDSHFEILDTQSVEYQGSPMPTQAVFVENDTYTCATAFDFQNYDAETQAPLGDFTIDADNLYPVASLDDAKTVCPHFTPGVCVCTVETYESKGVPATAPEGAMRAALRAPRRWEPDAKAKPMCGGGNKPAKPLHAGELGKDGKTVIKNPAIVDLTKVGCDKLKKAVEDNLGYTSCQMVAGGLSSDGAHHFNFCVMANGDMCGAPILFNKALKGGICKDNEVGHPTIAAACGSKPGVDNAACCGEIVVTKDNKVIMNNDSGRYGKYCTADCLSQAKDYINSLDGCTNWISSTETKPPYTAPK